MVSGWTGILDGTFSFPPVGFATVGLPALGATTGITVGLPASVDVCVGGSKLGNPVRFDSVAPSVAGRETVTLTTWQTSLDLRTIVCIFACAKVASRVKGIKLTSSRSGPASEIVGTVDRTRKNDTKPYY